MAQQSRKDCLWAYALQASEGTAVTSTGQITLPLPAGADLEADPHYSFVHYANGVAYERVFTEGGTWAEGDVRVPLIPGYVGDIFTWILDGWATVWMDLGGVTKKFYDVRVKKATFTFAAGKTPECTLSLIAKRVATGEAITVAPPDAWEYKCKEIGFKASWNSGTPATDKTLRGLTIEIDTCLESGEEGMRIAAQDYPETLESKMGPIVTGTITRDFSSSALYNAWKNGSVGSMAVVMARGSNTATITIPNVFYGAHPLKIPDDGFVTEEVQYHGITSADGTAAPITMAET